MANRDDDRYPGHHRALGLLALGAALFYGYLLFDPKDAAQAWNAAGAVARASILIALAWKWRGPELAVVAWWLAEEAMVAGCSAWFIIKPWTVLAGQDQCSSLLSFDIGKVSALVAVGLLVWLLRRR